MVAGQGNVRLRLLKDQGVAPEISIVGMVRKGQEWFRQESVYLAASKAAGPVRFHGGFKQVWQDPAIKEANGSIGYGGDLRGDLSNTQFALEGLKNTDLAANDEAFVKAVVFLQRTQNLRKVNDFHGKSRKADGTVQDVVPDNDGGAAYYPGNSPAGYKERADGSRMPRSYGSMTYALLKAYTLCGLPKDDPRIQAAVKWIGANWNLDQNPGSDPAMPDKTKYQGLYYYYMVMAQALDTAGIHKLQVPGEKEGETRAVEWRPLLRQKLFELQTQDGSWLNHKNERWWEDQKLVCTVYALLALERCN